MKIRSLRRSELPIIKKIDPDANINRNGPFDAMLRRPDFRIVVNEHEGEIRSYAILQKNGHSMRLLYIKTDPSQCRRGYASFIIDEMKQRADSDPGREIVTVVRESKLDHQLWLKKRGFKAIAVLHNYFSEEPGYGMRYTFESQPDEKKEVVPADSNPA